MRGKFHNEQLLALLKKLESIAFSGAVHLDLEVKDGERSNCILACHNGQLMYALPYLPDIHAIIDFLEHKLHRQWIAPAVEFASRQLKDPQSTQELIERLISMELFTWGEIEAVFYAQTIVQLEKIWHCAGSFWLDKTVLLELRSAWKVGDLLLELSHRDERWTSMKSIISSMQLVPHLSLSFECANIPPSVKNHLTEWVDGKRSLEKIAHSIDKDPLQIAHSYYKWVQEKWVTFEPKIDGIPLILAIDDSAVVQQMIQRTLSSFCRVAVASNAVDGLSIMYHQPVKLLLLDVMMPEIDGLEVCRTIRRMPQFSSLPIIMLTGKDGFFDKMKGRMAGSNEYITKPFEAESLKQLVRQYLSLNGCEVKLAPKADPQIEQKSQQKAETPVRARNTDVAQTPSNRSPVNRQNDLEMPTSIQYQHSSR